MPVQLRFQTGLTGEEYVTREGWRLASLAHCPLHPRGGCGFARHGTYARVSPPGTRIARWYCPRGHCTFSLLPDHLAARFPGTLAEIERAVSSAEQAQSLEAAADRLRPDAVTLPSALRWLRRRLVPVRAALRALMGLFPQWLAGCAPRLSAVRARLGCEQLLVELREIAQEHLPALGPPLGLRAPSAGTARARRRPQQRLGPDPPRPPR